MDLVLALGLTLISQLEIWTSDLVPAVDEAVGSRLLLGLTTLLVTMPLAWRRAAPLAVLLLVMGTLVFQATVTTPNEDSAPWSRR